MFHLLVTYHAVEAATVPKFVNVAAEPAWAVPDTLKRFCQTLGKLRFGEVQLRGLFVDEVQQVKTLVG